MKPAILILLGAVACLHAAPPHATADELAPGGTLRASFLAGNPVQGRVDAATGAVSGPAPELVAELARQRGLPLKVTPLAGVRAVLDSVKSGAADIGFLAFDPARAAEVDFSQTYSLAHNTYMVPAASPIRALADIDKPGIRIGVGQGDAADLYLTRTLKSAALLRNPGGSLDEAKRKFETGEIAAYAANRQRLTEAVARMPGMRLLDENFYAVEQAIIVPKGESARLLIVNQFLDAMRGNGFIRAALDRAKLTGVDVAPPKPR